MNSEKQTIKIFCRLKPSQGTTTPYDIITANHETGEEFLQLSLKPAALIQDFNYSNMRAGTIKPSHYINNKPEQHSFRFSKVFDRKCKQDYVFSQVAAPVIDSALEGYNGTIFAYGQTGSGKTFTMTGGSEQYEQRGIIPRTLEYIFEKFQQDDDPTKIRNVFVSYLEIYNDGGYDLLTASSMPGGLEDLSKVTLMEDANKEFNLRNLSVLSIETVEEAINYLYLGDRNRTIAETPLNEASTRSHCIFTIYISVRDVNSALTCRSKLNLVDLAGSERIANSNVSGQLLTEARHINLALHYLEQVIVALSDSHRTHVPYRNSMMTSVLRDSLGGNCMTTMIATLSLESDNVQESISTCRFAQRVALVTNTIARNEDLDPTELIAQLKQEIKKLKEILSSAAVKPLKEEPEPLDAEEKADCRILVDEYLRDPDPEAVLPIVPDMRIIQECFRILKSHCNSRSPMATKQAARNLRLYTSSCLINDGIGTNPGSGGAIHDSLLLANTLTRREAEIKVLMQMLHKEKSKTRCRTTISNEFNTTENKISDEIFHNGDSNMHLIGDSEVLRSKGNYTSKSLPETLANAETPAPTEVLNSDSSDLKETAFLKFMENYSETNSMEVLRSKLQKRKEDIKELERVINSNRSNMESLKTIIEDNKHCKAMDLAGLKEALVGQRKSLSAQEEKFKEAIEDVGNMESLLENQYKKLMVEYETWLAQQNKDTISDSFKNGAVAALRKQSKIHEKEDNEFDLDSVYKYESSFYELGPVEVGTSSVQPKKMKLKPTNNSAEEVINPGDISTPDCYKIDPPNTPVLDENESEAFQMQITGDPETDNEIRKFLKTRQQIFNFMSSSP